MAQSDNVVRSFDGFYENAYRLLFEYEDEMLQPENEKGTWPTSYNEAWKKNSGSRRSAVSSKKDDKPVYLGRGDNLPRSSLEVCSTPGIPKILDGGFVAKVLRKDKDPSEKDFHMCMNQDYALYTEQGYETMACCKPQEQFNAEATVEGPKDGPLADRAPAEIKALFSEVMDEATFIHNQNLSTLKFNYAFPKKFEVDENEVTGGGQGLKLPPPCATIVRTTRDVNQAIPYYARTAVVNVPKAMDTLTFIHNPALSTLNFNYAFPEKFEMDENEVTVVVKPRPELNASSPVWYCCAYDESCESSIHYANHYLKRFARKLEHQVVVALKSQERLSPAATRANDLLNNFALELNVKFLEINVGTWPVGIQRRLLAAACYRTLRLQARVLLQECSSVRTSLSTSG